MTSLFSCLCMSVLTSNSSGNMQKRGYMGYLGCFHAVSTRENLSWVWVIEPHGVKLHPGKLGVVNDEKLRKSWANFTRLLFCIVWVNSLENLHIDSETYVFSYSVKRSCMFWKILGQIPTGLLLFTCFGGHRKCGAWCLGAVISGTGKAWMVTGTEHPKSETSTLA